MEKLKDTTVKVKTKTDTATKTVILISVGIMMAGAIVIGSGFGFAMSRWIDPVIEPKPEPMIVGAEPLMINDMSLADISFNPSDQVFETGNFTFRGVDPNGFITETFGTYNHNFGGYEFVDGNSTNPPLALAVVISTTTHPAMYITLRTSTNIAQLEKNKLPGIKTAYAQVSIDDRQFICIPEKSTPDNLTYTPINKLPGIKTAYAQVNINPITYFVDIDGNIYSDTQLTERVSNIDCPTMIANNFSPNDIFSITPDQPVNISVMVFAKSWNLVLAQYFSNTGFVDNPTGYDIIGSGAPLFVMGANNNEETITQPETILTIKSDLGTKNVCMPQQVLESQDWFVFFVNSNGKPYSDMLLTLPIACGTTNSCSKILCDKQPDHPCCVIVQQDDNEEAL